MATSTYDPDKVKLIFAGFEVYGYGDGTTISVDKDEDTYTKKTGATGHTTRVRSRNAGGKVTVTLEQSSSCNDLFSAFHTADLVGNYSISPLLIKEINGTTSVAAPEAWIMKVTPVEYGKDAGTRTWVIDCADMVVFAGGLKNSLLDLL